MTLVILPFNEHPLLQARAVGDELVVGLVPDSEILRCKGPPVQNEEERKIMVEAVKWVGQVITGAMHAPIVAILSSANSLPSTLTVQAVSVAAASGIRSSGSASSATRSASGCCSNAMTC